MFTEILSSEVTYMSFNKLTAFTKKVADAADQLTGNPADTKALFDAAPEELRTYFNNLIDALKSTASGDSGAKNTGATAISGVNGTDVQSLLEGLKTYFDTFHTDHGIGAASKGYSGDLNNLLTAGNYSCVNATNAPIANEYFFVSHYMWDANSHMQTAVQLSSGRMWVRTKNVSAWGPWNEK
jgi:hypothetical protein